jgi:flagellar hook protein FlgE
LDENGEDMGSVTNIRLNSFTSPPEETDLIQTIINLDADGKDNSTGSDTSLYEAWNASDIPALGETAYEYQTTVQTYDSLGSTHDITLYFDKAESESAWEFIVTCNPDDDKRTVSTDKEKGMLARGKLTFDKASGVITDIALQKLESSGAWSPPEWPPLPPGDVADYLTNGYFTVEPQFIAGNPMNVKLDFGARYDGTTWVNDALTSTQFARASNTVFQASNGYGAGDLQSVNVDTEGVITGTYSNGQLVPLYRLALAKFQNNQGLFKEGGNMFRETRASGAAITNRPGTNGLGSISPNSLEQSNVDLAGEFVKMIITQRGFQANSKIITVTDQMLADLINLKR